MGCLKNAVYAATRSITFHSLGVLVEMFVFSQMIFYGYKILLGRKVNYVSVSFLFHYRNEILPMYQVYCTLRS